MGDRATVVVKCGEEKVYLYTHWGGHAVEEDIYNALRMRERWDDLPYLARIIFCKMVRGHEDETTGYGISSRPQDGIEWVVDLDTQTICKEGGKPLSFEFIANGVSVEE